MKKPRVLIVDDEAGVRESLRMILSEQADCTPAATGEEAMERLGEQRYDVVLLDIIMPGMDGLEALERIRSLPNPPEVIMVTATKTVKTAVRAMKLGAFDYITKSFDIDEIQLAVERAAERASLREEVEGLRREVGRRYRFENVIGNSESMRRVLDTVQRVARSRSTVLLTGESGTGKEVIAKAIHFNSPRTERPLITLNCAAIPDTLLESELFGHERGAFTDAHTRKAGQFENADRGTIFLDEIGDMNPGTQAKILRVLEQGTFTRVGSTREVKVDVRVIAATNRNLQKAMEEGTFRPDLYFRLNVVAIHLPPLRERKDDLPLLIRHFLRVKARDLDLPEMNFIREALDLLIAYDWPGNVRQLENVVERAMVLARGSELGPEDLPAEILEAAGFDPVRETPAATQSFPLVPEGKTLDEAVAELETSMIRRAMEEANSNQTRAAEILGTTRRVLKYKMDKLGIRESRR